MRYKIAVSFWWVAIIISCFGILVPASSAQLTYLDSYALPYTGGAASMLGDLVPVGDETAVVFSKPVSDRLALMFYRFAPDLSILVQREVAADIVNHYEPSLCWDGQNFAVVSSTYNQATFMILSPAGDYVLQPMQLPNIPAGSGSRTAGFRVLWTGNSYAVFGLWGEPEYIGSAYFYSHLVYWRLDGNGQVLAFKDLRVIQPLTYPGSEGYDKRYFDVAWTGAAFFVAYDSEGETGQPLSVYYKMIDLEGNTIKEEAPVFAGTVAIDPVIAFSGQTIAVTALKTVYLEGNHLYVRFFDTTGTPRAVETEYGGLLGAGPTVFWDGGQFTTAYAASNPYNPTSPVWNVFLNSFDDRGNRIAEEYPLTDSEGHTLDGTMSLATDLELAGRGQFLFGKAQHSDAYMINEWPIVFLLKNNRTIDYNHLFNNSIRWQKTMTMADLLETMKQLKQ